MATLTAKTVRLACNQANAESSKDVLTGENPLFWKGAAAAIQCALFNGSPSNAHFVDDTSNIGSIELIVRKHNARGPVLINKLLLSGEIQDSSWQEWNAGTGQQFTFDIEDAYLSYPTLDAGSLPIFYAINVITDVASYIAAQGYGQIVDVGIADLGAPALPTGFVEFTPSTDSSGELTLFRGSSSVRIVAQEAAQAYTFILVLPGDHVFAGAFVNTYIEMPATANVTIEVRDTLATGPLIHSVDGDTDNPTYQRILFLHDGNEWVKFGPAIT